MWNEAAYIFMAISVLVWWESHYSLLKSMTYLANLLERPPGDHSAGSGWGGAKDDGAGSPLCRRAARVACLDISVFAFLSRKNLGFKGCKKAKLRSKVVGRSHQGGFQWDQKVRLQYRWSCRSHSCPLHSHGCPLSQPWWWEQFYNTTKVGSCIEEE